VGEGGEGKVRYDVIGVEEREREGEGGEKVLPTFLTARFLSLQSWMTIG